MNTIYYFNYKFRDIYFRKIKYISFNTLDVVLKKEFDIKRTFMKITQRKIWHQNGISGTRTIVDTIYSCD